MAFVDSVVAFHTLLEGFVRDYFGTYLLIIQGLCDDLVMGCLEEKNRVPWLSILVEISKFNL